MGWARGKGGAAKRKIVAIEAGDIMSPGGLDNAEVFVGHGAAFAKRKSQIGKFLFIPTHPNAKDKPAAGGLICPEGLRELKTRRKPSPTAAAGHSRARPMERVTGGLAGGC